MGEKLTLLVSILALYKLRVKWADRKVSRLEREWLQVLRDKDVPFDAVVAIHVLLNKALAERDELLSKGMYRGWKSV